VRVRGDDEWFGLVELGGVIRIAVGAVGEEVDAMCSGVARAPAPSDTEEGEETCYCDGSEAAYYATHDRADVGAASTATSAAVIIPTVPAAAASASSARRSGLNCTGGCAGSRAGGPAGEARIVVLVVETDDEGSAAPSAHTAIIVGDDDEVGLRGDVGSPREARCSALLFAGVRDRDGLGLTAGDNQIQADGAGERVSGRLMGVRSSYSLLFAGPGEDDRGALVDGSVDDLE
jgi:hypothetical protein